ALSKGLLYAHIGWLFDPNQTSQQKFSPDLLADRRIKSVDRWFPGLVAVTLLLPPLIGGLWGMSIHGALTAFFWATWSGLRCCTTSPGRSTPSATRSAPRSSRSATSRGTWPGWRSPRSASPGTTCTTPTPPAPATGR